MSAGAFDSRTGQASRPAAGCFGLASIGGKRHLPTLDPALRGVVGSL